MSLKGLIRLGRARPARVKTTPDRLMMHKTQPIWGDAIEAAIEVPNTLVPRATPSLAMTIERHLKAGIMIERPRSGSLPFPIRKM
jgi:hypothetical protein